ncbi:MAG: hypothetical protein GF393_08560, partial [Armatimonadia bacterium]|nr:hypothetical protein [Armatimonadia bacterium]
MRSVAAITTAAIIAGSLPAMAEVSERWRPAAVERECEDFDRGNVRPDPGIYGPDGWAIMNDEELPNFAEYDFESDAGWFELLVRYAARDPRPVALSIDGEPLGDVCTETTGSWQSETARWFESALVHLDAGEHTLRLERAGPVPHIDAWALSPVDIAIDRRLHPDGTWSLEVADDPPVAALEVAGRPQPLDTRLLPGARVWLLLEEPDTRVGPLMLPNLSLNGRLRRASAWIDGASECLPGLARRIGDERAEMVAAQLERARQALTDCAQQLQATAVTTETSASELETLLERIAEIEREARAPVYIACGAGGQAHLGLRKLGYHTLVGNQLVATPWTSELDEETNRPRGPRQFVPGIASLSFYPPRRVTFFSVSRPVGMVEFLRDGERLEVIRDEHADGWHPHRLHTEYFVEGGGHIAQEMCVADDVAVVRLRLSGLPDGVTARVVGEPLVGEATSEPEVADGAVSLGFNGGGRELAQAVAVEGVDAWQEEGAGYAAPVDAGEEAVLTIAATIHPDVAQARERVTGALASEDPFARAEQRWAEFFGETLPRLSCPDPHVMDAYYMTGYVLFADRYDMPEGGIWDHPYVVPSKWTWRGIWPEDLAHALTGLRWLNDPETAHGCLRVIRDHFFNPDASKTSKVHAYGLLTMATWQVFERYGDVAFLAEIYPTLTEMHAFIAEKTDEDGDGLPAMWDSFMLGWDSSRRFDYEGNLVDKRHFRDALEPIDAAVYHWRQAARLAQMAAVLSDEDGQRRFGEVADAALRAINEHSWDPEAGFYYDLFAEDNRVSRVKSCAGIFPLLGGELAPEREEALVGHLT